MFFKEAPRSRYTYDEQLGTTGVPHGGRRSRVEDEWHPSLQGWRGIRILREMRDNDAIIGGAANIIEQMIEQVTWRCVPSKKKPRATIGGIPVNEFVQSCLDDMSHTWAEFSSDVLSMLWFGWAAFEKVYKRRDGIQSIYSDNRIGFDGFYIRRQETLTEWEWDAEHNDQVLGWWQQPCGYTGKPVFLPMDKLIHFRTKPNRANPEGRTLLRNAYRSWYMMKRLQEIEGVGFSRNLEGMPWMNLPLGHWQDPTKKAPFERMVQLITRNEFMGGVFPAKTDHEGKPTGFDMQLLTSGSAAAVQSAIREAIQGYQREIAINFNTQFQQLGSNGGSHALSSDQTSMFAVGLGAILRNMKETLNRGPIDEVQEINGIPVDDRAYLEHSDIEKPELDKFATALQGLTAVDLFRPDRAARAVVRDLFSMPEEQDDVDMDDHEDTDPEADALADDLMGGDDDGGGGPPVPTMKGNVPVPEDVRATASAFLAMWKALPKTARINSVVMMTRAKRLSSGNVSQSMMHSIKDFFATSKIRPIPGVVTPFAVAQQYWDANGGDAGQRWTGGL